MPVGLETVSVKSTHLSVSEMTENHIEDYCQMFRKVFAAPPWNETWSREKTKKTLLRIMRLRTFKGFTAVIDGKPAGFITGYSYPLMFSHYYLEQLFVSDTYRKRHIGTSLLTAFLSAIRSDGFRSVLLLTKSHSDAEIFYHTKGFNKLPLIKINGKTVMFARIRNLFHKASTLSL